ncbi:phosphocarrier protein [Ruminococcus sp. YE71]|uniref:HPr family phosphocarrier protein n=1 Tax=unclassified Ruminococcus TaxID=2608920 RepID=UPI0008848B64|nr:MULTISPECIES: HPr family phosphocarrier protein [unclassified Ruminococcus]SDA15519.1 phosphocarrier protein [Ruminococcus sp. YE78]SFW22701.1 phosphocarrier protein [Ruminococcus sp. YE71]
MVSKTVIVLNDEGLHMRPAGVFSKAAQSYKDCEITLVYNGKRTNAKSVMAVMMAGIDCGARPTLEVSGENEQQVLDELAAMFENRFN